MFTIHSFRYTSRCTSSAQRPIRTLFSQCADFFFCRQRGWKRRCKVTIEKERLLKKKMEKQKKSVHLGMYPYA